jgi:hypothetical protein
MGERKDRCGTCRFWSEMDEGIGECHRAPPALPATESHVVAAVRMRQGIWDGVWPSTEGDDWCGEWRGKDGDGA